MIAVFKREFKACFTGIIGWLFMAVILFLYGLYFFVVNVLSGYPYVSYTLQSLAFIMLIAVPVLTMRVLSEERRNRTDQLMLTAPVSLWKIVLGKFLALGALYTLDILIIAITPLVLSLYGTVPMGESYTAILGFWLYGLACISIGVFVSGLTESQIISAVITFVLLFVGYLMNNFCNLISQSGNVVTKILSCYDLYSRLGPFLTGTLDLKCVVYFITVMITALFLTIQVIEKRRWSMSVKKIGLGTFSILTIVAVVGVCVLANFGIGKAPVEYTSIDVTESKVFNLTDETKNYLKNLDEDVNIYVWAAESAADTTLKETLKRMEGMSSHVKVTYISPADQPAFYTAYAQESPEASSLMIVTDKRSRVVGHDDIYEKSMDYQTYSQSIDAYDAEGQIISAMAYVTMDDEQLPKVYILEGHDELTVGETYLDVLKKANITSDTLNLLTTDAVPDDCQLLVINDPMSDLSSDDSDKIHAYIEDGGTVLLTTSFDSGKEPVLESLLGTYGITKEDGVVMEYDSAHIAQNMASYLLPILGENSYTEGVTNGYVFAPFAAGLTTDKDNADYEYTDILMTTDKAKVVKVDEKGEKVEGEGISGPFHIGVAVNKADEAGMIIVFGSAEVLNSEADSMVAGSNSKLFKGIVDRHVNERDLDLPVIPSKPYTVDNLMIDSAAGIVTGMIIMVLLPLTMIVAGIVIWASRRRR